MHSAPGQDPAVEAETESAAAETVGVAMAEPIVDGSAAGEAAGGESAVDELAVDEETAAEPIEAEPIEAEPIEPDPVLLAARDQARAALAEITDASTIGADMGHEVNEEHVLTLFFENTMPGYPGWRWAAAVSRIDEHSPVNVLEVELLPGEGALTAPAWLPWSERLAQYKEAQALLPTDAAAGDEDDDDDFEDDDLDSDIMLNDFSDFDDEIDGVDVDGEGEATGEIEDKTDDSEDEDDDLASDDDEDEEE